LEADLLSITADAIVIGAGVVGSATALELARAGRSVVVLDRGPAAGCGTTSASSAIIRFNYSTYDGVSLAWEASRYWAQWRDYVELAPDRPGASYTQTGMIMLDAPTAPRERTCELYEQVGIDVEHWSSADLRRQVPAMDPGRYWPPKVMNDPQFWADADGELGATYVPDGGFIDDALLATQNLAAAARARGVQFAFGREVVQVNRSAGRVVGVSTSTGESFAAPVIVNAAGPWSRQVNQLAGAGNDFTIGLRPLRVEVHQVPAPAGYNNGAKLGPVITDLDLGTYIRPARGDLMLIGGTEPDCDQLEWLDDPDTANPNRTQSSYELQTLRASRRFPGLQIPNSPKGVVGVYDATDDWTPIYDRTDVPGFYVAIGTSGNQFKNAPLVGQLMASVINAVEEGHDHDLQPVIYKCRQTSNVINLGSFSRLREPNPYSTGTVLG
jgi:glycine/D-amino acid oxidase-like deaminating enzyme